jgi:ribosomal protein S18 acetylase RimI-like enzyme
VNSQIFDSAPLEQTEAEWMYRLESGAPPHILDEMGIAAARFGGGYAVAMRRDVTQYWNKALGFGFDEPVTADLIAQVCEFFRVQEAPMAVLQLAPSVLPAEWGDICRANRLEQGGNWLKLGHDLGSVGRPDTDLRVAQVEVEDATAWATALLRGFGMPEEGLLQMAAAVVGQPGFRCYAAWDGDEIVGVGNSFVDQGIAALWGASTLASHRRRGAQSALLAIRLLDAKAAGCRMAVAETGAEGPGEHNQSLHNLRRAGFSVLYERPNWVWRPEAEDR